MTVAEGAAEDGRTARAARMRQERKAQVVAAATRRIASQGYVNTSVADVIDEAGISRGTFYLYFASREALFEEIVDRFVSEIEGVIEVVTLNDDAPAEKVLANFRRAIELLVENPDLTKVLFREALGQSAEVDARIDAFYAFMERMVVGALRKGVARGISREVDVSIIAPAMVGAVKEVVYKHVVRSSAPVDPDQLAVTIFDFAMRGLRADG
jgi:AcrR family transcriptional regulator